MNVPRRLRSRADRLGVEVEHMVTARGRPGPTCAQFRQTTRPPPNLDAAIDLFDAAGDATYSVAWIDCLSRGDRLGRLLVMLGEHAAWADLDERRRWRPFDAGHRAKRAVPFHAPSGLLNRWTVRAFNELYFRMGARKAGAALVDWGSYFYPLDAILGWNRIYRRQGFLQFQCVLPLEQAKDRLRELREAISETGEGSFLAVLKRFGPQTSRFSFAMLRYTLALDLPVHPRTPALVTTLDHITMAHGGRFYLPKDSRMTADTLQRSDLRAQHFTRMRPSAGLEARFRSGQSERLRL